MNKFGLSDAEYKQLNSLVIEPLMLRDAPSITVDCCFSSTAQWIGSTSNL